MNVNGYYPANSILYIPHGGGPLPLLDDKGHQELLNFLYSLSSRFLSKPAAILLISAHWEQSVATITSGESPGLIYDYYGFPDAAYRIEYPAAGEPQLALHIANLLQKHGIPAVLDAKRGFDHGLFVPLKILFPNADIPCLQLSLINDLNPQTHIKIGNALGDLSKQNVLILGSGFSFHNMAAFFADDNGTAVLKNNEFQQWLIDTCCDPDLSTQQRESRLIDWQHAPYATYCHPRAEHLLPLHVCFGVTGGPAKLLFNGEVLGKKTCAFLW